MTIALFLVIALMRVAQTISKKNTSSLVNDNVTFFHYGGFYQLISAVCAFIALLFSSFSGFNTLTLICAVLQAILFTLDLYTGLESVKGGTLLLATMFAMGGLFIPCIVGIFLFNESMSVWQWLGLAVFIGSVYLLVSDSNKTSKKISVKTLLLLIANMIINGLVMVVQKVFALWVDNGNVALYSCLTFAINAVFLYLCMLILGGKTKRKQTRERVIKPLSKKLIVNGIVLAIALFSINQLITILAKTIPSVILFTVSSALSIIITAIIGALVFKEKLTLKKALGIIIGIISILIINYL